jgi:hypothetical protein
MANRISFLKKIKIFREFKKVIKLNKIELEQVFGARIDKSISQGLSASSKQRIHFSRSLSEYNGRLLCIIKLVSVEHISFNSGLTEFSKSEGFCDNNVFLFIKDLLYSNKHFKAFVALVLNVSDIYL